MSSQHLDYSLWRVQIWNSHPIGVKDIVDKQLHLPNQQWTELLAVLKHNGILFDGSLGVYPRCKINIDIKPIAKTVSTFLYPLPWVHLSTFKHELDHRVRFCILYSNKKASGQVPTSLFPEGWIWNLCQWKKVINASNILYQLLLKSSANALETNFSWNLTYACTITHLTSMRRVKTCVPS